MKKTGNIVITGRPNVGKSTLLNWLCERNVSIVCRKPQTTQIMISHVLDNDQYKIGFIDTPGLHKGVNKLSDCINEQVKLAYKKANAALLVVEAHKELNEEDLDVINLVKSANFNHVILVVNKIDLDTNGQCQTNAERIQKLLKIDEIVYISATNKTNLKKLFSCIDRVLDNSEVILTNTEDDDNYVICEAVREQLMIRFRQEIPYSTCCYINHKKYDEKNNIFDIYMDIVVEKPSQRPIIIGKKAQTIKEIRVCALKKLRKIFDCKINLHMFLVVRKNWRNDEKLLKDYGFNNHN